MAVVMSNPRKHIRISNGVALIGAGFCILLLALRIHGSISFLLPLQLITSGDEQSSLLAMWKVVYGQPVYHDRFQIPYDSILYNWLFYVFYGTIIKIELALFSLGDAWIPTLGRMITLSAVAAIVFIAYRSFLRALDRRVDEFRMLAAAFAIYVAAGPLIGFWAVTVRPDILAFAFDAASAAVFLAFYPRRRWTALLLFVGFSYLSWSCKQSNVYSMGAAGLFLLIRRQWVMAAALAAGMTAAFAVTLGVGSPTYVGNMLFSGYPLEFIASHGLDILKNWLSKTSPSLVLCVVVIVMTRRQLWSDLWRDDTILFSALGVLMTGILAGVASIQSGSGENYYFMCTFYMAIFGIAMVGRAVPQSRLPMVLIVNTVGWISLIAAIMFPLSGKAGVVDVRDHARIYDKIPACLVGLPHPMFSDSTILSMPWITGNLDPFVLSYTYQKERAMGKIFAENGVGGLINKGYFPVLILSQNTDSPEYDGASLAAYRVDTSRCSPFVVYERP